MAQEGGDAEAEAELEGEGPGNAALRAALGAEGLGDAEGALQGPEERSDGEGLGHDGGGVEDEVAVDGGAGGGDEGERGGEGGRPRCWRSGGRGGERGKVCGGARVRGEEGASQAVDHDGKEDAAGDGLEEAHGEWMGTEDAVDCGDDEGVEEGPVRGGCFRRGEGIPGAGEAEAFAFEEADGEPVVGALVGEQRRGVYDIAVVEGDGYAKENGEE